MNEGNSLNGYGDANFTLAVCIEHPPEVVDCQPQVGLRPLKPGDIAKIVAQTSNHWRKIFNLFAKIQFGLTNTSHGTWQQYRERQLLQAQSGHALLFSVPDEQLTLNNCCYLVSGKTFAEKNNLLLACHDIGDGFYIHKTKRIIVTPYFDYRQLSNAKLERLITLITAI